jgi:hypothetical protein
MKILLFLTLIFGLLACSKYDEGPALTFLSKKSRLSNHWELETATANDEPWSPFYPLKEMIIEKDNTQTCIFRTLNVPLELSGKWEFVRQKEQFELQFDNGFTQRFRILKLKEDELKLSITSNDTTYVLDYITYR